ncbi:MAG: hypothetical protein AAGD22_02980 [Verrucomicrobiota bacterium]
MNTNATFNPAFSKKEEHNPSPLPVLQVDQNSNGFDGLTSEDDFVVPRLPKL